MEQLEPIVFLNGDYLPESSARISPLDRGFVYADGVYEVVRFYKGRLFEMEKHAGRLHNSLSGIFLEGIDPGLLQTVSETLIDRNGLSQTDGIVYFQATRGTAPRKHPFPKQITPTVFATASVLDRPVVQLRTGVPVLLLEDIRWSRCDIKSVSLLPNVLASERAVQAGCYEAVFHRDGWVTEGSRTNIFIRNRGQWQTHPADRYILNGVTRMVVMDRMKEAGLAVLERPFSVDDLFSAQEAFLCSTTSEVMPVIAVNGKTVKNGLPGPETTALQRQFEEFAGLKD